MDYELISGLGGVFASGIETLLRPLAQSIGDLAYFALIYDFLHDEIGTFRDNVLGRAAGTVGGIALVVMTLWIFFQALRIITGQSRDSMMALVMNSLKATLIIAAATAFGVGGNIINDGITKDLQASITELVTGEAGTTPKDQIDENLAYMQLAMSSIDAVKVMQDNNQLQDQKAKAILMVGLGTAGPAMTGAAMLLLYEVALAMFVGFGPIFILCLLFDQTKSLFQRWLMYGIGTLFSMAVLSAMIAIATNVIVAVTKAFWAATLVGTLLDYQTGFSTVAMQQGGIGLLLTVLIISTPPMAANFFQGTLGNFSAYATIGGGGAGRAGAQPGESGYRGSTTQQQTNNTVNNQSGALRGSPTQPASDQPLHGYQTGGTQANQPLPQTSGLRGAAPNVANPAPTAAQTPPRGDG
jgi:type IV secretion system protein VirB6